MQDLSAHLDNQAHCYDATYRRDGDDDYKGTVTTVLTRNVEPEWCADSRRAEQGLGTPTTYRRSPLWLEVRNRLRPAETAFVDGNVSPRPTTLQLTPFRRLNFDWLGTHPYTA